MQKKGHFLFINKDPQIFASVCGLVVVSSCHSIHFYISYVTRTAHRRGCCALTFAGYSFEMDVHMKVKSSLFDAHRRIKSALTRARDDPCV